jgi:hypothetical protein
MLAHHHFVQNHSELCLGLQVLRSLSFFQHLADLHASPLENFLVLDLFTNPNNSIVLSAMV